MPMDDAGVVLFTAADAREHGSMNIVSSPIDPDSVEIHGVVVDSRQIREGFLFVALPGERTDGHNFLEDAAAGGAAAVVVSEEYRRQKENEDRLAELGITVLAAEHPLAALQSLAVWWVDRHPECIRIGVTGSNGKTTTKEILASILRQEQATVWNEGNLNSEIGLPLAVFSIGPQHRYGVFEMGINHPGEMAVLARVLRPQYMVLTMLGTAHIGLLGSRRAIAEEKSRAFAGLPADGAGFIPEECPWEELFVPDSGAPLYRFGTISQEGYEGAENRGLGGWLLFAGGGEAEYPLVGSHNLYNALAAMRVARHLGISWDSIRRGLSEVRPSWGRGVISRGAVTIVEDSYNANAESVSSMLYWLSTVTREGRLIYILGSMKELGSATEEAHRRVGRVVAETKPDAAFFLGEETGAALDEARTAGFDGEGAAFSDFEELEKTVRQFVRPGDTVLLKGSRVVELERLVEPIREETERGNNGRKRWPRQQG
jgi:UDP-N-acetylmuramoyl-tripeptide--D-alanyl-D-alanine ligase